MGEHGHPEITMHTYPLSNYMVNIRSGEWEKVAELMTRSACIVTGAGADFVICPDNTIHQAFEIAVSQSPVPWLHIAEAVAKEAKEREFTNLGILGTKYLMTGPVYPDALIVQAHRDPVHSVPSMCSLSTISRSLFSDTTDLGLIPAQWTQLMVNVANRSIQFREKTNNGQFLDVPYNQLVQDTLGTVQWIYDWAGMKMSEVFKEKMTTWLEQSKRRRKQNPHQYSLEQFGLTEESIQKKFESYYDQYRGLI